MSKPVTVLVVYEPKKGSEKALEALVRKHWPTLRELKLVTDRPAELWRSVDVRSKAVAFVEKMEWKDEKASEIAHQTPEVMAMWEPMGAHLEKLTIRHLEELG